MNIKSTRNKTIHLTPTERLELCSSLLPAGEVNSSNCLKSTILGDCFEVLPRLPAQIADLAILDPPYNLYKKVGAKTFGKRPISAYTDWLMDLLALVLPTLKPTATVYLCGDWYTSLSLYEAATRVGFHVRDRITWEREKGRGSTRGWKSAHEDVWFCTLSSEYTFNVDNVMVRRAIRAPYRDKEGLPKDWKRSDSGVAFRDTCPSNLWTDLTIPFWSMSENTEHPTQKSEKFCAKLILASSNPGDVVLSPFLGSGTDSVVAKKLKRKYIGIEIDEYYALIAQKRLKLAEADSLIQGYNGIFFDRNNR